MNSRNKGKRGERQWRDELRAAGYTARRGQQFSGSPDSPDVVCPELDWIHFEVKAVERLNIEDAMEQARRDCNIHLTPPLSPKGGEGENRPAGKVPVVAHKRNFRAWLVTMTAETFFKFLRGELPPGEAGSQESGVRSHLTPALSPKDGEGDGAHGVTHQTIFRRDAEKDSRDGCATHINQETTAVTDRTQQNNNQDGDGHRPPLQTTEQPKQQEQNV